jgi:hypothetical protein
VWEADPVELPVLFQLWSQAVTPFSEEDLIETYGDQAYHRGLELVVGLLRAGDAESCRRCSTSVRALMLKGYHKHPKTPAKNSLAPEPSSVMPCDEGTGPHRGSQKT